MHVGLNIEDHDYTEPLLSMVFRILVNDDIQALVVPFGQVPIAPREVELQAPYSP